MAPGCVVFEWHAGTLHRAERLGAHRYEITLPRCTNARIAVEPAINDKVCRTDAGVRAHVAKLLRAHTLP